MPREFETGEGAWAGALEPLRSDPARTAILTDVDGTLAPIVERAEEAVVPAAAREALRRLSTRYGLVGCISGRRAEEARRLVGLDDIAYRQPRAGAAAAGRRVAAARSLPGWP